jgi:hypothetical protein
MMAEGNTYAGTVFDAEPGDVLRNTHWEDKFTCPNCHEDHRVWVSEEEPKYVNCRCGKRLRLQLETVPEAACYIADPDEETEESET